MSERPWTADDIMFDRYRALSKRYDDVSTPGQFAPRAVEVIARELRALEAYFVQRGAALSRALNGDPTNG